jgi:hypothetical protein
LFVCRITALGCSLWNYRLFALGVNVEIPTANQTIKMKYMFLTDFIINILGPLINNSSSEIYMSDSHWP